MFILHQIFMILFHRCSLLLIRNLFESNCYQIVHNTSHWLPIMNNLFHCRNSPVNSIETQYASFNSYIAYNMISTVTITNRMRRDTESFSTMNCSISLSFSHTTLPLHCRFRDVSEDEQKSCTEHSLTMENNIDGYMRGLIDVHRGKMNRTLTMR